MNIDHVVATNVYSLRVHRRNALRARQAIKTDADWQVLFAAVMDAKADGIADVLRDLTTALHHQGEEFPAFLEQFEFPALKNT